MVDKKYKDYCKEIQGRFDPDLKDELKRANRVKLASIADINTPQLIISGVDEKVVVNHDSLYSGLSENEYRYHAISILVAFREITLKEKLIKCWKS